MLVKGHEFTIGADPELFVEKEGQIISAHGLVEGTKENPFIVEGGAVQVDGTALEFNIDPSENFEEFQNNLDIVQNQLKGMIGDLEFSNAVSNVFCEKYFATIPEESKELGCEPDFNAYNRGMNPPPNNNTTMRCTGGHVHIGGFFTDNPEGPAHLEDCYELTKNLDRRLGQFSTIWDRDRNRRSLYGKAGAFRPKPYGMEYRSLSGAWIFNPFLVKFVYEQVKKAIEDTFENNVAPFEYINPVNIINRGRFGRDNYSEQGGEILDTYYYVKEGLNQ